VLAEAKRIEKARQLLKEYYAGQRMESPNGGFLILLGIRPQEGGTAVGVFECSASSLRYEIVIPKATRTERKKVRDVLQQDGDPDCPRHGPDFRLARAGKNLVCNRCGVAYARV
jgi:ribosomal protein S27AE